MSAPEDRFRFVLVGPQSAGNIGAVARAMKNFGFSRLDLVEPKVPPDEPEAVQRAVGAVDLLENARVHATLDEALEGTIAALGTSRRRGRQRRPHSRADLVLPMLSEEATRGDVAFVFGREAHGLSDAELDRCTHLAWLPTSDACPSLNLSHAVALIAHSLRLVETPDLQPEERPKEPAAHELREAFYEHWASSLLSIGYLTEETAPSMMRRFRRLFGRTALGRDDLMMLRGLARQIDWAAGQIETVVDDEH